MGLLLGYAAGVVLAVLTKGNGYKLWWVLVLPMLVDGVLQLVWNVESNNIRRVITGFLAGTGIIYFFIFVHKFTVWWVIELLDAFY